MGGVRSGHDRLLVENHRRVGRIPAEEFLQLFLHHRAGEKLSAGLPGHDMGASHHQRDVAYLDDICLGRMGVTTNMIGDVIIFLGRELLVDDIGNVCGFVTNPAKAVSYLPSKGRAPTALEISH